MKRMFKRHCRLFLIILVGVITIWSRFINLNWDRGYGFHPDENNLWGASRNVKLFSKLDPEFYAYGGFPIYLYSFIERKETARAISAVSQVAIIILLFATGRLLAGNPGGVISALLGVFSAGLVQAAHFATVESLLGVCGLLVVFGLLKFYRTGRYRWIALSFAALGLGVATKVSFLVFGLPFVTLLFGALGDRDSRLKRVISLWIGVVGIVGIFLATNPYIFWKWPSMRGTLRYESDVAMGKSLVFYARQFTDTIPGLYHAIHIFPYITSWLFLPIFVIGLLRLWRQPVVLFSVFAALISFIPLWAKWTRYVVQVLPVMILVAGVGAAWIWKKERLGRILAFIVVLSFTPQFLGVVSVYSRDDTRIEAAQWAEMNIPKGTPMFTEAMEIGIVPFNPVHGSTIILMNFYDLDVDQTGELQQKLDALIAESQYFISPSMRVWRHVLERPDLYPKAAAFYKALFDGSLGYTKVYDSSPYFFPLPASRPSVMSSGSNDFTLLVPEETFEVFDHPRVLIFEKQ